MRLVRGSLTLCIVAGLAMSVSAREVAEIVRVSFSTSTDGEGQVIRLHATTPLESDDIEVHQEELNTAFILIREARVSPGIAKDRAVDPVRSYRLSQSGPNVRVDLQFDGYRPVRIIAYPDRDSNDALVSVHYSTVRARPGDPIASVEPAFLPGSNGDDERWSLDCVVIDAGHGGEDLGAVANGLQEKDINLSVAKRLGEYVEEDLDLRVIYTRTTDRFLPLEERGRIANEQCGKLFISLHVNSAPSRTAEGTEIFFLGLHKTEAARRVMERENSVIRLENDPEQYAAFGDDQYILQTLAQSAYLRESETLAGFVDAQFRDIAKRFGRGVKQAGFLVLWKASMPAILVELGFITNRREAAFLNSPDGQDHLAKAVYRAIVSYRDFYEKGLVPVAAE
ncbi:MAG TPA: N-acetylmuramoyl-L-alanine amidase [Rhodothermia bacterium]|nr:N-acetylmuramoyl-L-alanine amidase [Rhodothermia bacterium]